MELLPESDLFKSFHDQKQDDVFCMTIGGTKPGTLLSLQMEMENSQRYNLQAPDSVP